MSAARRRLPNALAPMLLLTLSLTLVLSQLRRPDLLPTFWPRWAEIGLLAIGMTPIVLTGGIDLSVGSIVALCGMSLGLAWRDALLDISLCIAIALGVGLLCGIINATLVRARIAPLAATLATMALFSGAAMAISGGERISGLPSTFCDAVNAKRLGVSLHVWALLVALALSAILIHATPMGRALFAIGENRLAARFAALPIDRIEFAIYALNGLCAGWVAILYAARSEAAVPTAGAGLELQAIACVVLGGTKVTGGSGGIGPTLLGILILSHLDIGLQLLGTRRFTMPFVERPIQLDASSRMVVVGVLLVLLAIWNERARQTK